MQIQIQYIIGLKKLQINFKPDHENKPSQYPFNYKETEMDFYNNEKGRQIAIISNLNNVIDNIINDLNSGYLRYLNNLNLNDNYNATYNSILIPTDQ